MKSEQEVQSFLDQQGVPYIRPIYDGKEILRVMDLTQVPGSMREQFDERGFFVAPKEENKAKGEKK